MKSTFGSEMFHQNSLPLVSIALVLALVARDNVASGQKQVAATESSTISQLTRDGTAKPTVVQPTAPTSNPINQQPLEFKELHEQEDNKGPWPLVNVDRNDNKSQVGVHVPIFFDMDHHNDAQSGHNKLDLSVMHGLVTVSKDKVRGQDGQLSGPMKVTVFGIPVYNNKGRPVSAASLGQQSANGQPMARSSGAPENLSYHAEDILQKTEDKVLSTLSGIFGRLSRIIKQEPDSKQQQSVQSQQTPTVKVNYVGNSPPSSPPDDIFKFKQQTSNAPSLASSGQINKST